MPSPTVPLSELAGYLAEYLDVASMPDYGPNGVQVEGRAEVGKIVTGVSACLELFEQADAAGADAILVHHGIFWRGMPYELTGVQLRRVAALIRSEMSLLAYHLPLDRHHEVGNNAIAARRLGLEELEPFGSYEGTHVGWRGRFPTPISFGGLVERCRELYGQDPVAFGHVEAEVRRVGIISGGAQKELHAAIDEGLDAFVTGEASEWVMNLAHESGVGFVSAGHYATERFGVQELGRHLAERFGIEVVFRDVPNPV
jgi:dinuclear metal center YbgI/SA1388 family protein